MRQRHHYPNNWYDTIRPEVLKRDRYVCVHCGIRHRQLVVIESSGKWVKVSDDLKTVLQEEGKRIYRCLLNVAHVDQNKSNNDYSNLMSLCVRCHARFDSPYKFKRGKCVQYKNQKDILTEIQLQLNNKVVTGPPSLPPFGRSVGRSLR
jgi:5-methylcytosine-specific restriction endonuclease McrA